MKGWIDRLVGICQEDGKIVILTRPSDGDSLDDRVLTVEDAKRLRDILNTLTLQQSI